MCESLLFDIDAVCDDLTSILCSFMNLRYMAGMFLIQRVHVPPSIQ